MVTKVIGAYGNRQPCDYRCDFLNDQSQMNSAVAGMVAGDTVKFTTGYFSMDGGFTIPEGVNFIGSGPGTVLYAPDGDLGLETGLKHLYVTGSNDPAKHSTVGDFTLKGRLCVVSLKGELSFRNIHSIARDNGPPSTGIGSVFTLGNQAGMNNVRLDHVRVYDPSGCAFVTNCSSANNLIFNDCVAVDCASHTPRQLRQNCGTGGSNWSVGFSLESAATITNALFIDCIADNCYNSGFHVESVINPVDVRYIRCLARNNGVQKWIDQPNCSWWSAGFVLMGGGARAYDCVAIGNQRGFFGQNGADGHGPKFYRCLAWGNYDSFTSDGTVSDMYMEKCTIAKSGRYCMYSKAFTPVLWTATGTQRIPAGSGMASGGAMTNDVRGTAGVNYIFDYDDAGGTG